MTRDEDRNDPPSDGLPVARAVVDNTSEYDVESASFLAAHPWGADAPVAKHEESYGSFTPSSEATSYWGRFHLPEAKAQPMGDTTGEFMADTPAVEVRWDDREVRHAFIRKVYMILAAQMLVTFGVCALMSLHKPTQQYVLYRGEWLMWTSIGLSFVVLFALNYFKREYPTNMILLGVFTLAMSCMIGFIASTYAYAGASGILLEAVFLTATVFIVLTLFTLQTKWDFSFLGAGLGMCLWILILWSFLALIFGFQTGSVYALIGSVVFSGFIIFDTYMLAERLDPQDYVIAAIELYLDILNLFLMILRLLSESDSS